MAAVEGFTRNALSFASQSLYVGDLHPDTTENDLLEKFSTAGPITSVRLCRDNVTQRSLGYGYINFHDTESAERALSTLNFTEIRNRQCRVCWSQRDSAQRRLGDANLHVKNLPESMDNLSFQTIFSKYGNILSSKVVTDAKTGKCLGYGFVNFDSADTAKKVISMSPVALEDGTELLITAYSAAGQRGGNTAFTNVYVKNLPDTWTNDDLSKHFSQFGNVTSSHVTVAEHPTYAGRKFGFVNFSSHDEAQNAVENAGTIEIDGKKLYAVRAQTQSERDRNKREAFDARRAERRLKWANCNLFVKHLPETVTEEKLLEVFAAHGTVTSSRINTGEDGRPTGIAFVCFSTPEEAAKAVAELNRTTPFDGTSRINVSLHESKAARAAHQQLQQGPWGVPGGRMPNGYFTHPAMAAHGMMMVPGPYGKVAPVYAAPGMYGPMGAVPYGAHVGPRMPRQTGSAAGPRGTRHPRPAGQRRGPRQPQGAYAAAAAGIAPVAAAGAFDGYMFSLLSPEDQRSYLGELIFPRVSAINADQAPKITGMLLEMDADAVIKLLHSEEELRSKVTEAMGVLHTAGEL